MVDLDLESPGLCSAVLASGAATDIRCGGLVRRRPSRPRASCNRRHDRPTDMASGPSWRRLHRAGHGAESGEYLAKLGRVYLDTNVPWTERLKKLLEALRAAAKPSIVLLESRSGLHDIAAATVTDMNAQVLLFATDSETTWQGLRHPLSALAGPRSCPHDQGAAPHRFELDARHPNCAVRGSISAAILVTLPRLSVRRPRVSRRALRLCVRTLGGSRPARPDPHSLDARTGNGCIAARHREHYGRASLWRLFRQIR